METKWPDIVKAQMTYREPKRDKKDIVGLYDQHFVHKIRLGRRLVSKMH